MNDHSHLRRALSALPKAEIHVHLEGSMSPATVTQLAARYGVHASEEEVAARYRYQDFLGFIEAFKWATSFLRTPDDYALIARGLAEQLLAQNVIYAEATISAGVMLWRKQDIEKNITAINQAAREYQSRGLQLRWIPDVVRQFGGQDAIEVARHCARLQSEGVVAFGMGGDELALPASDYCPAFDIARNAGLHIVVHAGEIGGPESVTEAIEVLGAERIGHGIAVAKDPALMARLAASAVPLEVCPTSNLRTGALAKQLGQPSATLADHPIATLVAAGVNVTISTDDPAMFEADLISEYVHAAGLGLAPKQLAHIAEASFRAAFLPDHERNLLLKTFHAALPASGLI
jgi:aminodeoxyfutalosine deaminase